MAQNVVINGVTYSNVPEVDIPLSGGGIAQFLDTSDATLDNGGKMLSGNTAYADGVKYTGTFSTKTPSDLSASDDTVIVPAGYYAAQVSKAIDAGTATAPSSISGSGATITAATGVIKLAKTISVTPSVTAGYVSSGTAGNSTVELTASATIKAATTYTPGTSDQTISAGTWCTGAQTISGDANLVAANIKSGVSIFGVNGALTAATVFQDASTKILSIS